MTILVSRVDYASSYPSSPKRDYAPSSPSSPSYEFIIEKKVGFDKSMEDYAKMVILFAINTYPEDDYKKCLLMAEKFEEKYKGCWNSSFIKNGDTSFYYQDFYIKIKYGNYTIKLGKLNLKK